MVRIIHVNVQIICKVRLYLVWYLLFIIVWYKKWEGTSGAMHSWIVLSTFDASLDGLHISLELASTAFVGVVHQGGFSSHSVYTRLMERLSSDHWVCLFLQGEFPRPWTFGKNLRTPLRSQGFLFLVFFVRHFYRGGSKVVSKIYLLPINARAADFFPSAQSSRRSQL